MPDIQTQTTATTLFIPPFLCYDNGKCNVHSDGECREMFEGPQLQYLTTRCCRLKPKAKSGPLTFLNLCLQKKY